MKVKKKNASEESIAEVFLRNSIVTLTYVKNTHKTHECQKKKKVAVIQPEHFKELEKELTGSVLQNGCSEKFEKIIRKTFDFTDKNTPPRRFFFAIFENILEQLRGAASESILESSLNSFLCYRSSHSQELQKRI